jgi:hypothetical protein
MPVPADRNAQDYFKPLADLEEIAGRTKIYLGLIHHGDGIEGAMRRIRAAQKVLPEFGVTTECGLGRRDPETISSILNTFAQVSAPVV